VAHGRLPALKLLRIERERFDGAVIVGAVFGSISLISGARRATLRYLH
jgi:hypothetical protein